MCDKVQFSEMMCIRRSFKKKLLHFFMPFELQVIGNLNKKTSRFF
jgi:hypothetical protein